jgi:toxin YoeB
VTLDVLFTGRGWDDYQHWVMTDRRVLDKLNRLILDARRSPFEGIGKPEALRHDWSGYWSRRITDEHRLVYRVVGETLEVAQCRFHYGD